MLKCQGSVKTGGGAQCTFTKIVQACDVNMSFAFASIAEYLENTFFYLKHAPVVVQDIYLYFTYILHTLIHK